MKQNYMKGVLLCLLATTSWGGMFPVMTTALRHIDPFTFTAIRYTLAGLAFVALLLRREGPASLVLKGERVGLLWLLGSAGFAGFGFLVFLGQKIAGPDGALTASIMMATMPMLGFLVNWALRGVRPPAVSFGLILMSFFGIVLVLSKGDLGAIVRSPGDYRADLFIIVGAFCWVLYTIGASLFPAWSPLRYTAVTTALGLSTVYSVVLVLLVSGKITPSLYETLGLWPQFIYMAFVAGCVAVLSWNIGNKIITPMNGVLFMDVVPITAFTVSAFTGVIPCRAQLVGAAITAAALVLNNLYLRAKTVRSITNTDKNAKPAAFGERAVFKP